MNTKVIAFFLPQYHEIKENNEWWGEGFTEWTNVKNAKPLFKGHYQPKVPLNKDYYDMSDVQTLHKQSKLAKCYGVDGFCFYHYWFNGRKLLERPLELLLEHKDIDIEFCFSWANETWSRRWNGEPREILIKQEYGNREDWEKHIQYLSVFFADNRYIKIKNKPVLLLYRAFDIPNCREMISYWQERVRSFGFEGIYIIETLNSMQKRGMIEESDALTEFEPMYTIHKYLNKPRRIYRYLFHHLKLSRWGLKDYLKYQKVTKLIINRKYNDHQKKKIYLGVFPEWDNTARKGERGLCVKDASDKEFRKLFEAQYRKSLKMNNEFIFINAWNEWGEGAYLEPDEKKKYAMLETICAVRRENEISD